MRRYDQTLRNALLRALLGMFCAAVTQAATHTNNPTVPGAGSSNAAMPAAPIRHVFVLLLENQAFGVTFGAHSPAPYLASGLASQGALLNQYYGIGHWSLDNYIALISGQAPNRQTQADCPIVSEFRPARPRINADGQALGHGCLYPTSVQTLPDQLEAAGLTWKGYMEDMGNDPTRESATCGHSPAGTRERSYLATARDKYAARHNPFIYFHRIIDNRARCAAHVVNLRQLSNDLHSVETTPNYVFITPNLCNDGHDARCIDGQPGGYAGIESFLQKWVPLITAAPAFKQDGLLVITFDESDESGAEAATACCGERGLPGALVPPGVQGPGGGRVGAVLLSPRIRPGTVSSVPYNHYSLLRSVEDLFGLPHLGYAGQAGLQPFGVDIFNR